MAREPSLRILLRITAVASLLALVAVYMPRSWMAFSHESLGLGVFPEGPITEYLARSASGLYAMLGGMLWIVAGDVTRYRPVIRYFAIAMLAFGFTMLAIDVHVGLPLWWILLEGPSAAALGMVILLQQRWAAATPEPTQAECEACPSSDAH